MKMLLLLSVLACSYAAKLDRTYLPPPGAATAGGSPGSLNAPSGPSGPSGFGQPSISANIAQGTFEQSQQSFGFNQPGKGFNQPANNYGQAAQAQGQTGFRAQPQKLTQGPSSGAASSQGSVENFGFGATNNFGADQGFAKQTAQPERPQAAADQSAEILKLVNENDGENFSYSFETSNGISAEESGVATNGVMAQGAFAYTGDDGQSYRVTYTADENGYQPRGDHLPTPPPIPEEILRSIEKNAAAAAAGIQEGAYREDENESVPQQYNAQQTFGSSQQYNAQQTTGSAQQYNAQQAAGQQYSAPAQAKPFNAPSSAYSQAPQNNYNKPSTSGSTTNGFSSTGSGQTSFSQTSSSQSVFAPSGSAPSAPAQSSFAPARPAQNAFAPSGSAQSSFAPSRPAQNAFGPSAVAPTRPSQNAFAPAAQYNQAQTQGFKQTSSQNTFAAQQQGASGYEYNRPESSQDSFRGPSQSVAPAAETFAPSGQQAFGGRVPAPSKISAAEGPISSRPASPAQGSFNGQQPSQQPINNGFQARPISQGFTQNQYSQQQSSVSKMSEYQSAPYQYNPPKGPAQQYRPASGASTQQTGGFNAAAQFNQGSQGAQTFGAPRQPPSFSQEEGYKY